MNLVGRGMGYGGYLAQFKHHVKTSKKIFLGEWNKFYCTTEHMVLELYVLSNYLSFSLINHGGKTGGRWEDHFHFLLF